MLQSTKIGYEIQPADNCCNIDCAIAVGYIAFHYWGTTLTSTRQAYIFLAAALISGSSLFAQPNIDEPSFRFLPGRTSFSPLTANYLEPRVGLRKEIASSRLKLDIGSTFDLLEYAFSNSRTETIRLGIDFFTYALTTNAEGLRLQIDAVDGIFGGHIIYQGIKPQGSLSLRLRLLHLSAHFVDGHFNNAFGGWAGGRAPIPYTRDFGELVGAYSWNTEVVTVMLYSGISYATLVRPVEIKRIGSIHGLEIHTALGSALGNPFNIFLADNLAMAGIPRYVGTNNLEFGVKFGEWNDRGVKLFFSYYSGLEIFSQYYNVRRNQWGVGFGFDVW